METIFDFKKVYGSQFKKAIKDYSLSKLIAVRSHNMDKLESNKDMKDDQKKKAVIRVEIINKILEEKLEKYNGIDKDFNERSIDYATSS